MLPKAQRITKKEYPKDFRTGRFYHSPGFSMVVFPGVEGKNHTLFSVVAPKKYIKKAVDRNAARRKVYAGLRALTLRDTPNRIIVITKKKPDDVIDIKKELSSLFKKAGLEA